METVDSTGTLISSLEYGFTIMIPPGAIPEGTEIQLQVRCCSGGPFVLPEGYRLCSPVYIISPSYHFLKDIELWIVHHAYLSNPEDCSRMTFVTNTPTQEEFDPKKPEYHLSPILGGHFLVHSVVGKVSVKHTCKKAIAAKISTDRETTPQIKDHYSLKLYIPVSPFQRRPEYAHVLFTVELFIPPYCKGNLIPDMEQTFPDGFLKSVQRVVLTKDIITLILPMDDAERQGYCITPDLKPCQVLKEFADLPKQLNTVGGAPYDSLEALDYPPRIRLTIAPKGGSPKGPLECELKIDGTQCGCAFVVSLHPPNTTGISTEKPSTVTTRWQAKLREIELSDLMKEVIPKVSSKWLQIGIQLKVEFNKLKEIESNHPNDAWRCCIEMFHEWLCNETEASWPTLVAALHSSSEKKLAQDLHDTHC